MKFLCIGLLAMMSLLAQASENTWVLILTLSANPSGGQVVTYVPGFSTFKRCEEAGEKWVRAQKPESRSYPIPNAVCVVR